MEMQDLNKEEERVEVVKEEERGMLETEVREEESNVYSRLEKPSEDIYSEAGIPYADKPSTKHRAGMFNSTVATMQT